MRKAGYCTVCNENVYLTDMGECSNGHPANCVTGVYDAPDADVPAVAGPSAGAPQQDVKKGNPKKLLPIIVVLVACSLLCAIINLTNPSDSAEDSDKTASSASSANEKEAPAKEAEPEPEPEPVTVAAVVDEAWGTFAPIAQSGSGDSVIDLPAGVSAGIVSASHTGSSNFTIHTLDANNNELDLLVNEIGTYNGTTFYIEESSTPTRLKIGADGPWTITIAPVSAGMAMTQTTAGRGDAVLLYDGESADWAITHNGESNFVVRIIGTDGEDLLVNEIGPYTGTLPVGAGPAVVILNADGDWSIAAS